MKQPTKKITNLGGSFETTKKPSMWVRNVQLATFSIIVGISNVFFKFFINKRSNDGLHTTGVDGNGLAMANEHYFLKGFTWMVWVMVINNAIGGLCVAMVIKHADNILKGK